jgi:XTP/dITP diphosphohydrolase
MKKLLIATHNPGKFKEYKILFKEIFNLPFNLISLNDLKIQRKVVEKGKNYEENAVLKAKFYSKLSKLPVLADDSGLEIEILDGWPGIKSRRKENGKSASDKELIEYENFKQNH